MPVVVATGSRATKQAPASLSSKPAAGESSSKTPAKKRKKRTRGQKRKNRVVFQTGEQPAERSLKNGKVRQLDLLRGNREKDHMPRKTREFIAQMKRMTSAGSEKEASHSGGEKAETGPSKRHGMTATEEDSGNPKAQVAANEPRTEAVGAEARDAVESIGARDGKGPEKANTNVERLPTIGRKFDGMQPGESFAQFTARLRAESRQMIVDIAKKGNHQREKRKAYHEKRRQRLERKKRRKRGEYSDNDADDGGANGEDEYTNIGHLPAYWQEIVRNNGRPVSSKKRKRLQRLEREELDSVAFGEQVERPPELSVLPVRRGRG